MAASTTLATATIARARFALLAVAVVGFAARFVASSPTVAPPSTAQANSTAAAGQLRPEASSASIADILARVDDVASLSPASADSLEIGESGYLPSVFYQGGGPPVHEPSYSTGGGGGYVSSSYAPSAGGYSTTYDSAPKADYANKASDWSLYDQGAHGLHDKYGDKAYTDAGYQAHASHGKRDSSSNVQNSHGSDHGSGYYSRDRGYGFERQYAFDRVIDSKSHSNNHQQYANSRGLYDTYGAKNEHNFNKGGHEKYGLANKYGHGYRQLGAHDDYAHGHSQPAAANYPPPLYKSNYYSGVQYPQMPSYY